MRQRSRPAVPDDAAVVENFLKLGGGGAALSGCQVCLSTNIDRIEAGAIDDERNCPELDGRQSRLQRTQSGSRVLFVQCQLRLN